MRAGRLGDPAGEEGLAKGALQDRLVEVMAAALAGFGVDVLARRRKDPLPAELASGVDVLAAESERKLDPAGAFVHVAPMEFADTLHLFLEELVKACGEHRATVAVSLPFSNDDLGTAEVDIFDAQAAALHQAKTGPVQETRHETGKAVHPAEHGAQLIARQHDGQPLGLFRTDDVGEPRKIHPARISEEKENRRERLVLRRGCHLGGRRRAT